MPDKDDHAWQAGAYILNAMGFDFTETLEPVKIQKEEPRGYRIEDDIQFDNNFNDIEY
jgi:hypothetical protein